MTGKNLPEKKDEKNLTPQLRTIRDLIFQNMKNIEASIPEHLDIGRLARIAFTVIQGNQKLQECTEFSLLKSIIEASQLGLEIGVGQQAHLVPFGREATLIIGFQGKIDLAYRSGKVKEINVHIVYEKDEMDVQFGDNGFIRHKPVIFGERGKKIGVYAIAKLMTGGVVFEPLGLDDLEAIKKVAKTKDIWNKWPDEMWKKSAIHRISKRIPASSEMQRANYLDDMADAGKTQELSPGLHLIGVDAPSPQGATDDNLKQLKDKVTPQPEPAPDNEPPAQEPDIIDADEPPPPDNEPEPTPKYTITGEQKGIISQLCEERSMSIQEAVKKYTSKSAIGRLQEEEAEELIKKLRGGDQEPEPDQAPPADDNQKDMFPAPDDAQNTMPDADVPPWPNWCLGDSGFFKKEGLEIKKVKAYLAECFGFTDNQDVYNTLSELKDNGQKQSEFLTLYLNWEEEGKG